ncbi:vitrin isoform X2 [Hemiscyllium ocellatum]|uniref:vitrin isoform X2 n=1 Tax=Hemiscyllium ocellatum TaxID=170820 RepID=UPI00296649EA|nr:vitrin isoform X2 [Hemiscyllium ocellatum]
MGSSPISVLTFVLLLTLTGGVKEKGRKSKRTSVPQIDCDIRAGKIKVSEFVARCPPGCLGSKQAVWGTDIYASISSVCGAAIHSGVIDNSGGKIHVRKVPSSSSFKGTFSYGVRSLSLPRWRESFVVSGPKQQKGVTYPSILEFLPSRTSRIRTGKLKTTKTPPTTATTTLKPTSSKSPTQQPQQVAHDVTTSKIHEPRTFMLSSPSQQPARSQPMRDEAFRGFPASDFASRNYPPPRAGVHRQEPAITLRRTGSLGASFANGELMTDPAYAWTDTKTDNKPGYSSKPGLLDYGKWVLSHEEGSQRHGQRGSQLWGSSPESFETQSQNTDETEINFWNPDFDREGFSRKDQDIIEDPISQGDPNCKVDLAFLMDGSWSIGRRRFRIQKSFLMKIAQALDIGIAGPLIGIVQFGNNASTEFNLQTYRNSDDLKNAIEKIPQRGGVSNVGRALSHALGNFFSKQQGNRGGAPNVVVVLVDGWPTDKVEEAARLSRESGINIFFITVEGADQSERQDLVERDFVDKAVCRTNGYFSINVPSWFKLYQVVGPLVKRVCDTELLACSKTCLNSADIGFVVDGSSSVGTGNFRTVLQFVANISWEFEISDTATRVGVVQYTYEQRLEFGFDKHSTKEALTTAITDIRYWSGGTSTGEAVSYALKHLFSNSKPNKRKLMIVITDGRSYDDVREPARVAHSNGVIAYAVGIAWAAMDELEYIASDPKKDHSFFVDEFDNLFQFVPRIVHNICQEFNSQPRN